MAEAEAKARQLTIVVEEQQNSMVECEEELQSLEDHKKQLESTLKKLEEQARA